MNPRAARGDYQNTLDRLASAFVARDIMVPRERLVMAPDPRVASRLLEENPEFDVIPIVARSHIVAYVERGSLRQRRISVRHLIDERTPVLDLLQYFRFRRFGFVRTRTIIGGYLHFSDLNHNTVKLPLFVLFEATESRIAEKIRQEVDEAFLRRTLSKTRFGQARQMMSQLRQERADLSWVTLLYFRETLSIARDIGRIALSNNEINVTSKVRNRICHADHVLVESHGDVQDLCAGTLVLCPKSIDT